MNEPVQLAPMLAAFEDDGDLTIRISDQWKGMAPALLKLIGETFHPRRLTLITPTDTKVFKLNGKENNGTLPTDLHNQQSVPPSHAAEQPASPRLPVRQRIDPDHSTPPPPEIAQEEADEYAAELARQQQEEQALAEQERLNGQNANLPNEEAPPPPQPRKRSRERPEPDEAASTACGRCFGTGRLEAGGACPVCQGRGAISHWGKRRAR